MRGAELIAQLIAHSPFVRHLGIELREIEDDRALLAMPFTNEVVTIANTVHGGAVSSLVDVVAWSAAEFEGERPGHLQARMNAPG